MKNPKAGTKIVVVDEVHGTVTGEVVRFHRDGSPIAKFADGTEVVVHDDMYTEEYADDVNTKDVPHEPLCP